MGLKMKKNKPKKNDSEKIAEARAKTPEHVDWQLCADTVDSLHRWVYELCEENKKLKSTLNEVIKRIHSDNIEIKEILKGINLQGLDSKDSQDH